METSRNPKPIPMEIELKQAGKKFGRTRALNSVSMQVGSEELVAVLGLNGAGKSTLLRALSGTMALSEGELFIDGERFRRDNLELRREMFFVPDTSPLFETETLLRNLSLFMTHYQRAELPDTGKRVIELLEEFDLLEKVDTEVYGLSRGQGYRAAMVVLCAIQPKLWLLDEPFASGMDANGIRLFRRHAQAAVDTGSTVIYSTQLVELAEDFSSRICVVHEGKLIADTTPNELRQSAKTDENLAKLLGQIESKEEGAAENGG